MGENVVEKECECATPVCVWGGPCVRVCIHVCDLVDSVWERVYKSFRCPAHTFTTRLLYTC